jgi:hypothetical protein
MVVRDMKCQLVPVNRKYGRCTVCLRLARHASGDDDRECPGEPVVVGLGDMVKAGLSAVGITQERVASVLGSCGGCEERQEALNEFGRSIGIGRAPDGTQKESA